MADPYFTTDEGEAYLGSTAPEAAKIEAAREIVESRFERICGVAFVPRVATEVLDGPGRQRLRLAPKAREIVTATNDGEAIDLTDVKVTPLGAHLEAGWPAGEANIAIEYEHGFDAPPPEVKQAALRYLREVLGTGPTDDRAIRVDLESGSYQRAIAGKHRPTGIPDVDVVLADYTYRAVG